MSFDYSNLYTTTELEFLPHSDVATGSGLNLSINLDILTLDFLEASEIFFDEWQKTQSRADESSVRNDQALENIKFDIRYKAMILGGRPNENDPSKRVIKSWSLVRNGQNVAVSYEELCKLSQPLLVALYEFCTKDAVEVKKKIKLQSSST